MTGATEGRKWQSSKLQWPSGASVAVLATLAATPILATAVRAAATWRPVGDTAAITLRSFDVFTSRSPLVGMPTTLSDTVGQVLHHPGPLEFWMIAVVQSIIDHRTAPMIAVVGVNLLAVVAIVATAGWIAGRGGQAGAALLVALATWSLRGDYVIDPYNPYAAWLPLAAFAVALAAAVGGRLWALPVAMVAGSYAAQSHVSLVAPVGLTAAVLLALVVIDRFVIDGSLKAVGVSTRRGFREHRRPLLGALAAAVVCWAPVLVDMVAGRQNLLTLVGATGADGPVLGLSRSWQVVARAVTSPPWLVADRDPFATVAPVSGPRQGLAAVLLLAGIALAVRSWRHHRAGAAVLVVALSGLAGGMIAASRIPGGIFAAYALHNYLWLWPFTAALWAALVGLGSHHAARWVAGRSSDVDARSTPAALKAVFHGAPAVLAALVIAVAAMGLAQQPVRASVLAGRHGPSVGALGGAIAPTLDRDRPVVIDIEAELDQSAVAMGLVLELERRGLDVRVDPALGGSFGSHRVLGPDVDADRLSLRVGRTGPPRLPDGAEIVATHEPDPDRLARLAATNAELIDLVANGGGLVLATEPEVIDPERTRELVETGDLVGLGRLGLVVQPAVPEELWWRYTDAQEGPILFVTVFRPDRG